MFPTATKKRAMGSTKPKKMAVKVNEVKKGGEECQTELAFQPGTLEVLKDFMDGSFVSEKVGIGAAAAATAKTTEEKVGNGAAAKTATEEENAGQNTSSKTGLFEHYENYIQDAPIITDAYYKTQPLERLVRHQL